MQFYSARSWVLNTQVCNSCTGMHRAIDGKKRRTVGVDLNVLCKEKTIGSTKAHRESRSLFNVQHQPSVHQIVIICISAAQAHSHCWSTSPLTSTRGRLPIEIWGIAHHTSYTAHFHSLALFLSSSSTASIPVNWIGILFAYDRI